MSTLFTRLIRGELPSHRLLEDERFFSCLDIRPINPGHALVIPKKETDYLFDLEEDLLAAALPFAGRLARALRRAVPCPRIGVMVAGFEVPHAHIHLVPLFADGDLSFARAKPASPEALQATAEQIRAFL